MLGTMLLTMIADVSPAKNQSVFFHVFHHPFKGLQSLRGEVNANIISYSSTILMRFAMAQLVMELVITEAGAYLLAKNLYLPLQIFVPVSMLAIPLLVFMPETLLHTKNWDVDVQEDLSMEGDFSLESRNGSSESLPLLTPESGLDRENPFSTILSTDRIWLRILSINQILLRNASVVIVLALFFVQVLDSVTFGHVLQFLSKRLGLTFAEAGKLVPLSAVFKLVNLVYVIPQLTRILRTRFDWEMRRVELFAVIGSVLAMMFGNIVVSLCSSRLQFVFGMMKFHLSWRIADD